MPKVSVLIPLHNCEDSIQRALDSVYNQTFKDFEIVAVLNNCTDDTCDIIAEYAEQYDKVVKILTCDEQGIVPTLNTGIPHCTGELIARQDGDDIWYPTKLQKQVDFLDANRDVDIVGTQLRQVDADGNPASVTPLVHPTENDEIKSKLLSGFNVIVHPSVVFRKNIFLRAGTYDDHFKFAEDYHLWLKCCKWYRFANLGEVLIDYTISHNPDYNPRIVPLACNVMTYVYKNVGIDRA